MREELTGSLRQNLLWERQQKNATTNAVARRAQSAVNLPALRRAMTTGDVQGLNQNTQQAPIRAVFNQNNNINPSSYQDYFTDNASEYHTRGW